MNTVQLQKTKWTVLALSGLLSFYITESKSQTKLDDYLGGTPTLSIKGTATKDLLSAPADLDFNPIKPTELWVVNHSTSATGSDMVIFSNAGLTNQTSKLKKDANAWHFMCTVSGMAFGDNGNFSTSSNRLDDNHDGDTFTGLSLWSSDPTIFGVTPTGTQNGTHIDMIHMNPYSTGIAFDPKPMMLPPSGTPSGNAYWVFDGYNKVIALNDFVKPHCVGCSDHDDGQIYMYNDVTVTRDANVPSHIILDRTTGMLYICETAKSRVLWMNTKKGTKGGAMPANEGYHCWAVTGASFGTYISTGLVKPSGIDIDAVNKRLVVGDYSNGDIIIYNISGATPVEMGRIKTGAPGIMGIKIAPDGKIWYVNFINNTVVRVDPDIHIGVNDITANNTVSIYPNPVANELTVVSSFENNNRVDTKMLVYDAIGQKINEFKLQDDISVLNLSSYTNGVYFYTIENNNTIVNNGKLVVSK